MSDVYCYLRLRRTGADARALQESLDRNVLPGWRAAGIVPWGIWRGLFGVASDELIVVAAGTEGLSRDDFVMPLAAQEISIVRDELLQPTVRPTQRAPCQRPGLYVFRFFRVHPEHVDRFVELSTAAWTTFENAEDYAAQPQGLFSERVSAAAEEQDMLLVTWYDSLQSWETSRAPDTAARTRFEQRRALTLSTVALATSLLD